MTVKLAFNRLIVEVDGNGAPRAGAQLFTYVAGSDTKQTTYQESTGSTPNSNPIELDSNGRVPYPIWLTSGVSYKFVLAPPTDTDPPVSPIWTVDNITGINDTTVTINEWVSGPAPTYVSATSFTLAGGQTSTFNVGRRLKSTNTGGTIYSTIINSSFSAVTTVTVVNDSGTLDSGLSAVSYGLLSGTDDSVPRYLSAYGRIRATGKNFAGSRPTAATATFTADELIVTDSSGKSVKLSSVSVTSSLASSGVNGLDTGSEASNTTYYHYVIYNLSTGTAAGLFSVSATAPTLPSGYTYLSGPVQSWRNDGSSNIINGYQRGAWMYYVVRQNVLNAGAATSTTAVDLSTFVPSIAEQAQLEFRATVTAGAGAASNTSTLEIVSGSTFCTLVPSDYTNTQGDTDETVITVPNISQNVNYFNTLAGTATAGTTSLWVQGFSLPIGGQ